MTHFCKDVDCDSFKKLKENFGCSLTCMFMCAVNDVVVDIVQSYLS